MIRLIDIFIIGPIQLLVGYYTKNFYLKWFMYITGINTILYNLSNYLYVYQKVIEKPFFIYQMFTHPIHGKFQIHRLYNVFVMYPIFFYIYLTQDIPDIIRFIFLIEIIIGLAFNSYNFYKLST